MPFIQASVKRASIKKLEEYAAMHNLENAGESHIAMHRLDAIISDHVNFIIKCPIDKIFEMAKYNENKNSILRIEGEYGIKLDKTMKKRIPQLKELKGKL